MIWEAVSLHGLCICFAFVMYEADLRILMLPQTKYTLIPHHAKPQNNKCEDVVTVFAVFPFNFSEVFWWPWPETNFRRKIHWLKQVPTAMGKRVSKKKSKYLTTAHFCSKNIWPYTNWFGLYTSHFVYKFSRKFVILFLKATIFKTKTNKVNNLVTTMSPWQDQTCGNTWPMI